MKVSIQYTTHRPFMQIPILRPIPLPPAPFLLNPPKPPPSFQLLLNGCSHVLQNTSKFLNIQWLPPTALTNTGGTRHGYYDSSCSAIHTIMRHCTLWGPLDRRKTRCHLISIHWVVYYPILLTIALPSAASGDECALNAPTHAPWPITVST